MKRSIGLKKAPRLETVGRAIELADADDAQCSGRLRCLHQSIKLLMELSVRKRSFEKFRRQGCKRMIASGVQDPCCQVYLRAASSDLSTNVVSFPESATG